MKMPLRSVLSVYTNSETAVVDARPNTSRQPLMMRIPQKYAEQDEICRT